MEEVYVCLIIVSGILIYHFISVVGKVHREKNNPDLYKNSDE